jgi:hypothetical protein
VPLSSRCLFIFIIIIILCSSYSACVVLCVVFSYLLCAVLSGVVLSCDINGKFKREETKLKTPKRVRKTSTLEDNDKPKEQMQKLNIADEDIGER